MELSFSTILLRSICEHEKIALQHFDPTVVRELKARLADMVSADTLADMPGALFTSSVHKGSESILLLLAGSKAIIFIAGQSNPPLLVKGGIDWSKVYRVQIVEIGGIS